jgi:hypothetical protein
MAMTFYVEVDRRGDWRVDTKIVGLAASPALLFAMAQQPQVAFVDVLSAEHNSVRQFHAIIDVHSSRHHQGNPLYHQPEAYTVRKVMIIKRFFWIQHETIVFEIRRNLPLPLPANVLNPPFYIRVDRSPNRLNKSLAFDRVICLTEMPNLPYTRTLWTLQVNNHNLFNLLHLAALLYATFDIAPDYRPSGHNCFWHTSALERVIRERILAGQPAIIDEPPALIDEPPTLIDEPPALQFIIDEPEALQCPLFRRHACLGCHVGIPTNIEIENINIRYLQLLEQANQVQLAPAGPAV